jgi:hypothetical protein
MGSVAFHIFTHKKGLDPVLVAGSEGLYVYNYTGTSFNLLDNVHDQNAYAKDIAIADDGTIFLANGGDGIRAYNFNGISLSNVAHKDDGGVFDDSEDVAIGPDGTVFLAYGSAGLFAYYYSGYVGIENYLAVKPRFYSLDQNYPNPFNPTTKIQYKLDKPGKVILEVFNLTGQKVTTLVNKFQTENTYIINFDGSGLANGVYFYQLSVGSDYVEAKKMVLIK